MKHIVLLHGLHMHSWSLSFLKRNLAKPNHTIHRFGYFSTRFSQKTLQDLDTFISKIDSDNIILVGHSMGGLIARLYLQKFKPTKNISLITLGAPHNGSMLGKKIQNSFLKIFLGTSGQSGIVQTIPEWDKEYPMFCVAGNGRVGLLRMITKKTDHDGTVFIHEAIDKNCSKSYLVEGISHTQMIVSKNVSKLIENIIEEENL